MDRLKIHLRNDDFRCLALFFAIGFGPISALALSIFELWALPVGAAVLTAPLALLGVILYERNQRIGAIAVEGFVAGVIAVFIYDLSRWTLSAQLGLHDFIPALGGWLTSSDEPNWVAGYLWRYLGNGAGMGMGYAALTSIIAMLRGVDRREIDDRSIGVLYGIGVWTCLLVTLLVSPRGQDMMFPLTTEYYWVTLIGHVVYGGALGQLFHRRHARSDRRLRFEGALRPTRSPLRATSAAPA